MFPDTPNHEKIHLKVNKYDIIICFWVCIFYLKLKLSENLHACVHVITLWEYLFKAVLRALEPKSLGAVLSENLFHMIVLSMKVHGSCKWQLDSKVIWAPDLLLQILRFYIFFFLMGKIFGNKKFLRFSIYGEPTVFSPVLCDYWNLVINFPKVTDLNSTWLPFFILSSA